MSEKDQAKAKVDAASSASDKVLDLWRAAVAALGDNTSVNGYGIIRDSSAFRRQLAQAKEQITAAQSALDGIDWPSDADYDKL